MDKSKMIKGLIKTTEGYSPVDLIIVDLNDYKNANKQTASTMGFRIMYGLTENGNVYEFIKSGRIAKRDLEAIKKLNVIELVNSWAFAPNHFLVNGVEKTISKSFELGKDVQDKLNEWLKAIS